MKIQVTLLAPFDFISEIIGESQNFPELHVKACSYQDISQTLELVQQNIETTDVFLFAGPIPYEITRQQVEVRKPMIYLPHTGTSLYRVFFQMFRDNRYKGKDHSIRLSIDILKKEEILDRLDELEISVDQLFIKEYQVNLTSSDIMAFHYDLWKKREVDVVLTCVASVYNELVSQGVPCYRIIPTKSTIRDCLQRVELEGRSSQLSETQLAIGIIWVDDFSMRRSSAEYEIQRKKLALQQVLIDYSEEIQALLNWSNRDEITFVTTHGVIEKSTHNFRAYPFLDEIVNRLGLKANIGIGFGKSANEAESKAREALSKAKSQGAGSCYVMMQDGDVSGPIGNNYQIRYSIRSDDPDLIKLAHEVGLSVGTLNKVISFCQSYGSCAISALDLSYAFGVTLRSARRILSKLEQGNLAEIVGEEQPISRGRPRQLYSINIGLLSGNT
ncbi:helix-turn-helix domain-containing protein [Aneurinibacillus sp. REN35]|uniref:transcriptional regulator n=1 Tax=Aneurinibacillus sp. REN35 TaxID=3237286 RepID=UPI003529C108